jgi:hypothetical protein
MRSRRDPAGRGRERCPRDRRRRPSPGAATAADRAGPAGTRRAWSPRSHRSRGPRPPRTDRVARAARAPRADAEPDRQAAPGRDRPARRHLDAAALHGDHPLHTVRLRVDLDPEPVLGRPNVHGDRRAERLALGAVRQRPAHAASATVRATTDSPARRPGARQRLRASQPVMRARRSRSTKQFARSLSSAPLRVGERRGPDSGVPTPEGFWTSLQRDFRAPGARLAPGAMTLVRSAGVAARAGFKATIFTSTILVVSRSTTAKGRISQNGGARSATVEGVARLTYHATLRHRPRKRPKSARSYPRQVIISVDVGTAPGRSGRALTRPSLCPISSGQGSPRSVPLPASWEDHMRALDRPVAWLLSRHIPSG